MILDQNDLRVEVVVRKLSASTSASESISTPTREYEKTFRDRVFRDDICSNRDDGQADKI